MVINYDESYSDEFARMTMIVHSTHSIDHVCSEGEGICFLMFASSLTFAHVFPSAGGTAVCGGDAGQRFV